MAPAPALSEIYNRYKTGTAHFVQWLAQAARSTGTVEHIFASDHAVQKGRLKGKARKAAKEANKRGEPTVYEVPIKSIIDLAKAVAADPNIIIPRSVLTILGSVIRDRKECASSYISVQDGIDEDTKTKNSSHQYFIEVLGKTLEILGAKHMHTTRGSLPSELIKAAEITNMFAALQVEDTEQLDDIPDLVTNSTDETPAQYRLEKTDIDVSLAVSCFLIDLKTLQIIVFATWRDFQRGAVGLSAAALTMNAAIGMIERKSNDFLEANPRFKDEPTPGRMHSNIVHFVKERLSSGSIHDLGDPGAGTALHLGDSIESSWQKLLCLEASILIQHYHNLDFFDLVPAVRRLWRCMSQLSAVPMTDVNGRPLMGDLLHKAIGSLVFHGTAETWEILAVQILLDTQRKLGPLLPVASRLLEKAGRDLAQDYQAYLNTDGLEELGDVHDGILYGINSVLGEVKSTVLDSELQDYVDKCEESVRKEMLRNPRTRKAVQRRIKELEPVAGEGIEYKVALPTFNLLENVPSLCGLTMHGARHTYHRVAIIMAGQQGDILAAAHLYNATLVYGLLPDDCRWADMEHFIEKHGIDGIFVGKRPEDGGEILSHLALALGLTPKTSSKEHRHPKGSKAKSRQPRPLKHLARYSELGLEPYTHRTQPFSRMDSRASEDAAVMADWLAKDKLGLERSDTLDPIQTLVTFRDAIEEDENAFDFDVLALHLRCFTLIRAIRDHCVIHAPEEYPETIYSGNFMIDVVLDILMEYDGAVQRQKSMFPDVAKILQDVIVTEGSMCLDKAKARREEMKDLQKTLQAEICEGLADPDINETPGRTKEDLFGTKEEESDGGEKESEAVTGA